jgi:hypothetical protein
MQASLKFMAAVCLLPDYLAVCRLRLASQAKALAGERALHSLYKPIWNEAEQPLERMVPGQPPG